MKPFLCWRIFFKLHLLTILCVILLFISNVKMSKIAEVTCPWLKEADRSYANLQSTCLCYVSAQSALSVQCLATNFGLLMKAMQHSTQNIVIETLSVTNSSVGHLADLMFRNLRIINLELNSDAIRIISPNAFKGLENSLQKLSLRGNEIRSIPVEALRHLRLVQILDLSSNSISFVPDNSFITIRLRKLSLAFNNLTLVERSFRGLETSLQNLNLKGCNFKVVPTKALYLLGGLVYLDLAQNGIRQLENSGSFRSLKSLKALNLERNLIQRLLPGSFEGITESLSSLSLLNNHLSLFPITPLMTLKKLKVLDLGFNVMQVIPEGAFRGNNHLTLLALDGNPISTLPEAVFSHLNRTLKGLSLGGRFLMCDCKIRWVAQWIIKYNLQVTSRERNPQFCYYPEKLRNKKFYSLSPQDFVCDQHKSTTTTTTTTTTLETMTTKRFIVESIKTKSLPPILQNSIPFNSNSIRERKIIERPISIVSAQLPQLTKISMSPSLKPGDVVTEVKMALGQSSQITDKPRILGKDSQRLTGTGSIIAARAIEQTRDSRKSNVATSKEETVKKTKKEEKKVLIGRHRRLINKPIEILILDAYKEDNSIVIKWKSETSNILGFRVIYRLFGRPDFKQGPPLAPSEEEFRIKNVPFNECIVVCVVSLEEVTITPSSVIYEQCRELRTDGVGSEVHQLDQIIIPATAVIVAAVIIAVIIFIVCLKSGQNRRNKQMFNEKPIHTLSINGLGTLSNPGPPLAGLAAMGLDHPLKTEPQWDQMSAYSCRTEKSAPRSRMYNDTMNNIRGSRYINEDARSHIIRMSNRSIASRSRSASMADLTGKSTVYLGKGGLSGQDLLMSRQSLIGFGRGSTSGGELYRGGSSGMSKPRLNYHRRNAQRLKVHPGFSSEDVYEDDYDDEGQSVEDESDHWATSTENWSDYEQDAYIHRNPTEHRGARLGRSHSRNDFNL